MEDLEKIISIMVGTTNDEKGDLEI